jgi:hypothetical protein
VSTTSINFTAVQNGATPAAQTVGISIAGGLVFIGHTQNGGIFTHSFTITGQTTGIITVTPNAPTAAPGTYTGTITVRGCPDQFCNGGDVAGSPKIINVSYTIQAPSGPAANPQSLIFSQLQGAPAPIAQLLGISDLGGASYPWNASVVYQSGSGWLNINGASSMSGATLPTSLSIGVNPSPALGTLNALVRFTGNGRTLDVPVSYALTEPQLTPSPVSVTFNASPQGTIPATQNVTLSTQANLPLNYTTRVVPVAGATGWLTVPASGTAPGTITVGVNTTNLALGAYSANIFIDTATQSIPVGVTYLVVSPSLTFSPASASFTITTSSLPAALSQSVAVGSTGAPLSWTAASSQTWVSVAPASGNSGTPVTLSLDPAQLDTFDSGSHSATITFAYTPPGGAATTAPLSVSLDLQIPKVTSVNPYVATSGTSLGVILRGSGFSNPGVTAVDFAGTLGTNATVVSDTELRVTHPSLPAGSYRVSIPNQLGNPGIVRSTASLVVVDAPIYAPATIAYPPIPSGSDARVLKRVIYDAERKALIVDIQYTSGGFSATSREIQRYAFNGSAWSTTPTVVPIAFPFGDMAATLDGKTLLVTNTNAIQEYDMATLSAGASTTTTLFFTNLSEFLNRLAVANDGKALVTTGIFGSGSTETLRFSIADRTFSGNGFNDALYNADAGGSADGSRLVLPQNGLSPAPQVFLYNASTSALGATSLALNASFPALNRQASRILLGGFSIYDAGFQLLGGIGGSSPDSQTLSPDGTRAYAADRISGGLLVPTRLRTFDLSGTPVSGQFPEIGTGTNLPSDTGRSVITVSPDGGTVFIAGSDGIVVVPAP